VTTFRKSQAGSVFCGDAGPTTVAICEARALTPTFAREATIHPQNLLSTGGGKQVFESPLMLVIVCHIERDESVHERGMR
jgi:hypothetical protein